MKSLEDTKSAENKVYPSIVYATHNASSIKRSLEQMREKGLVDDDGRTLKVDPKVRGRVSYAQLLGELDIQQGYCDKPDDFGHPQA